jgi:opacity protein-like surface antigen
MKKILLFAVSLFLLSNASAQADSLKWVREINDQVWKPFIVGLTSGDKQVFRNVHSKRVTRVEIDRGLVMNYEKYFPPIDPNAPAAKRNGSTLFELRFDKRISNGSNAWESGFYKGTFSQEGKSPRSWYGRFYVMLEKENGTWKILVDADTGKEANEENFQKASSME